MADLAKQFTKEQIIRSIEHIDQNDIDLFGSAKYVLEHHGKYYPRKW